MGDLDKVVNEMIDETPKVTEGAIQQEMDSQNEKKNRLMELKDIKGDSFDPVIHVVKDGEPILGKNGLLKRKPGAKKNNQLNLSSQQNTEVQIDPKTRQTAYQLTRSMEAVARMALGDEWQYINDQKSGIDEEKVIAETMGIYLQSKGLKDIPPGVAMVLVMSQYIGPRLVAPQTKGKLAQGWQWFKNKFKMRGGNGTRADSRDNGERQDQSGKDNMQDVQK